MAFNKSDAVDARRTKSEGEKLILNALTSSKDTEGWIILHSLDVLHNEFRTQGEADFVILAPGLGVMVLEVKDSPSIRRLSSGDWEVGGKNPKRGSPFKQASESMWNIRNYLDKKGIDTKGVPFVFGVWFTRVLASKFQDSIEWKKSQILGAEDLAELPSLSLRRKFQDLVGSRNTHGADVSKLTRIANVLRPIVPDHANPVDRQKLLDAHLKAAIEQQKSLFAMFSSIRAVAVPGLAGTGKTYLAIAEAQNSHLRGEPALFLCYNKLLAADLKKRLIEYPYVRVATIHSLMSEIVGEDYENERAPEYWTSQLPKAAVEKLLSADERPMYETLIIDEAQDLGLDTYLDFLDLMLYGGLKKARIRLFGDFENQAIFNTQSAALSVFRQRIADLVISDSLTVNCRNTAQVGEFVADFVNPDPGYSQFRRDDPTTGVQMYPIPKGADPKNLLARIIEVEKKVFPANTIVVLSSQKEKLKALIASLPGSFRPLYDSTASACRFGSIQEFKGLEASSVVLVEFDHAAGSVRDHFYIAATRATANFTFIVPQEQLDEISRTE